MRSTPGATSSQATARLADVPGHRGRQHTLTSSSRTSNCVCLHTPHAPRPVGTQRTLAQLDAALRSTMYARLKLHRVHSVMAMRLQRTCMKRAIHAAASHGAKLHPAVSCRRETAAAGGSAVLDARTRRPRRHDRETQRTSVADVHQKHTRPHLTAQQRVVPRQPRSSPSEYFSRTRTTAHTLEPLRGSNIVEPTSQRRTRPCSTLTFVTRTPALAP
jgi:hypothetical protein